MSRAVWRRRVLKFAALAIATSGFCSTAAASDEYTRGDGYTRERFSIRLGVPQGYCSLDPSHSANSFVIRQWQQTFAQGEQLVASAVECAQLNAWRNPSLLPVDFTQYLVTTGWKFEGMTYDQRMALPGRMCEQVRQQTAQPAGESRQSVYARLMAARPTLGIGEDRIIGVIDEEAAACYLVGMAAAKTNTGRPTSVVHVRATAAIKGRILQFSLIAHTSGGKEVAALQRSADLLKATVRMNLATNNQPAGNHAR